MLIKRSFLRFLVLLAIALRFWSEGIDLYLGTHLSSLLTIVILSMGFFLLLAGKVRLSRAMLHVVLALLAITFSGVLSALVNQNFLDVRVIEKILKYSSYISILFIGSYLFQREQDVKALLKALMLGVGVSLVVALLKIAAGIGYIGVMDFPRATGMSSHPALFSMVLLITMYLLFLLSSGAREFRHSRMFQLVIALTLVCIGLSQARTAWIALTVFTAVNFYFMRPAKKIVAYGVGGSLAVAFVALNFDVFIELFDYVRLGTYLYDDYYSAGESTLHWRIHHWNLLVDEALLSPWVGHGPGLTRSISIFDREAHSSFVEVFLEQGVVGLLCFFYLLLGIAYCVYKSTRNATRAIKGLAFGIWIAILPAAAIGQSVFNETHAMQLMMLGLVLLPSVASARSRKNRQDAVYQKEWKYEQAALR